MTIDDSRLMSVMYRPDVVVVDFSVNDTADTAHVESYEGAVRWVLSADCCPAVVLLCNARYDNGYTAEAVHRLIAEHYGLPVVSIKDGVYSKILAGEYTCADLSPDGLHPNDKGHTLVAGEVVLLHGKRGTYTVDITVTEDEDGKATPFYLMSLIVA